jgi:DNA-binding transcriptional MerR regulator
MAWNEEWSRMYTVSQLSNLTRITVRTLHYYDEIGLLAPTVVGENGYRYYGDEALLRLQQILFFREMGLGLLQIKAILDEPDFDRAGALKAHREALKAKIERLHTLMHTIDRTLEHLEEGTLMREDDMFAGFSEEQQRAYEEEAAQTWDPQLVHDSNRRWNNASKAQQQAMMAEGNAIYRDLAALSDRDPADADVQGVIARWHQSIRNFYEPSPEMLRGLSELYLEDARFTATFDRVQPGLAVFMQQAVAVYVDGLEGGR